MGAYVVVELEDRLGDEVDRRAATTPAGQKLARILKEHDAVLLPSSPAAGEREASAHLTVQVPDMKRANRLATALRGTAGVKTAYAKPGEEMP